MSFRFIKNADRQNKSIRRCGGSVLPFVAFSMALIVAYLAFSVDITRNILAVRKLEFAADAAGIYAYSRAVDSQGKYDPSLAKTRIQAALAAANGTAGNTGGAWNTAPSGPANTSGQWNSDVVIDENDVDLVANPNDSNELFLRLTAARRGADALKQFFMPALRAFGSLGGSVSVDPANTKVEPYRTVEVVGQPACRIGAGAPPGQLATSLSGFATFPLAISLAQFSLQSAPAVTDRDYTIDLVNSQNFAAPVSALHMKGCFVNVAASGDSSSYYGTAQSNPDIDQLISLFQYFDNQSTAVAPAAVERAAMLAAYDSADSTFISRKQALLNALLALQAQPGRCLILPVVESTPVAFPTTVQVVGFARMSIVRLVNTSGDDFAITLRMEDSIALPNATCGNNLVSIPAVSGALLPAARAPFLNRTYDSGSNSLSIRPRGVVLAPALSPRDLKAS